MFCLRPFILRVASDCILSPRFTQSAFSRSIGLVQPRTKGRACEGKSLGTTLGFVMVWNFHASSTEFRGDSFSCNYLKDKLKKEKFVLGD
jgi:hypothetical protein